MGRSSPLERVRRICLALWCASSSDVQQMLATSRAEQFFVPAYVGHPGWIGVRKMPRPRATKTPSAARAR